MDLTIGAIITSIKILYQGETPCWMYREEPIAVEDSGWRVFSGSEDEVFLNDPLNFKTISAGQLIQIDDSLKPNLLAPIGSSFEKQEEGIWIPINKG
jgi:hypothetical protein